jgi:N-acetylglucosamine-6-phosphate deacetylase
MHKVLRSDHIFDGQALLSNHALIVDGGYIADVLPINEVPESLPVNYSGPNVTLVPGFNDLQVNGGGDVLFNDLPTVEGLQTIASVHRRHGTTGMLPTLISDDVLTMKKAIEAVSDAHQRVPEVLGIHLEGPFLSRERSGIHNSAKLRSIGTGDIEFVSSLSSGVTLLTLAPDAVSPSHIRELSQRGVHVFAGHSDANYEDTKVAVTAGVKGFTHLFNAMSPMQTRAPGMVGCALECEESWVGLIADGHHVHPALLKLAIRAKAAGKVFLVTDAMPSVGSSRASFSLDGELISTRDGCNYNERGVLAGSDLDMCSAVNNLVDMCDVDWLEALRMASLYPAQAVGLGDSLGRLTKGYRANIVALNEARQVVESWVDGSDTSEN